MKMKRNISYNLNSSCFAEQNNTKNDQKSLLEAFVSENIYNFK